jgi:hypothetical protein
VISEPPDPQVVAIPRVRRLPAVHHRTPQAPSGRSGASRASGQTGLLTIASVPDRQLGTLRAGD